MWWTVCSSISFRKKFRESHPYSFFSSLSVWPLTTLPHSFPFLSLSEDPTRCSQALLPRRPVEPPLQCEGFHLLPGITTVVFRASLLLCFYTICEHVNLETGERNIKTGVRLSIWSFLDRIVSVGNETKVTLTCLDFIQRLYSWLK